MNRSTFDDAARVLAETTSRRVALGVLVGGGLLALEGSAADARRKNKRRRKRARARVCYGGQACTPGKGAANAGCDFSQSMVFRGLDISGSNLSGANLSLADASGADLRGVSLKNACLAGATLRNALLDNATVLKGAIYCNTVMPDGTINNAHCSKSSKCCSTEGADLGQDLGGDSCVTVMNAAGCTYLLGQKWDCRERTDLFQAQLVGCDLTNAIFGYGTDLRQAELAETTLVGADLRDTYLNEANLAEANLTNAWLRGADLADVTWDATTCPDKTTSNDNGGTCCEHFVPGQAPRLGCPA
ncbi:MAG: pentapeptide repeat-containing protein [Thermomicrobiales bacterium]